MTRTNHNSPLEREEEYSEEEYADEGEGRAIEEGWVGVHADARVVMTSLDWKSNSYANLEDGGSRRLSCRDRASVRGKVMIKVLVNMKLRTYCVQTRIKMTGLT